MEKRRERVCIFLKKIIIYGWRERIYTLKKKNHSKAQNGWHRSKNKDQPKRIYVIQISSRTNADQISLIK